MRSAISSYRFSVLSNCFSRFTCNRLIWMQCDKCGGPVRRSHRRGIEKIVYSSIFKCPECKSRIKVSLLGPGLFGKHAQCPRCGDLEPIRRSNLDTVDSMSYLPFGLFHRLFCGKLYHCLFCRMQFYDSRPLFTERKRHSVEKVARQGVESVRHGHR